MCRYANGYKPHYACFRCRRAFKQWSHVPRNKVRCPECAEAVHDMGLDFKPPAKSDVDQWEKVRLLFEHGFTYHSCGCCGPGLRPAELRDVEQFLADSVPRSEGSRLLELIRDLLSSSRAGS